MGWNNDGGRVDVQYLDYTARPVPSVGETFGPFPCSDVDAIRAVVDDIVGQAVTVSWNFYVDQELTQYTGSHFAVMRVGGAITHAWPVLGAWVTMFVNPVAAGGSYTLRMATASMAHKPQANSNQNTLVSVPAPTALGIGGTVTTYAPRTYLGPAVWTAGLSGNSAQLWEAFLESETATGTVQMLAYACSRDGAAVIPVHLPARPVRVRFVNLDAAAVNYYTTLTADPRLF